MQRDITTVTMLQYSTIAELCTHINSNHNLVVLKYPITIKYQRPIVQQLICKTHKHKAEKRDARPS